MERLGDKEARQHRSGAKSDHAKDNSAHPTFMSNDICAIKVRYVPGHGWRIPGMRTRKVIHIEDLTMTEEKIKCGLFVQGP